MQVRSGTQRRPRLPVVRDHTGDLLEAALGAMEDGVLIVDEQGGLLVLNPAADELIGEALDWLLGREQLRGWRITTDSGETVRPGELPPARVLRGEPAAEAEVVVHRPGRVVQHLALSARRIGGTEAAAVLTIRDVTAWRHREDAAREAEERFRLTFEGAPVGMALVETSEDGGQVLQVNAAMGVLTGRTVEDLLSRRMIELVDEREQGTVRRLLSGEAPSAPAQLRLVRPDGAKIWVQVHCSTVSGAGSRYAIVQAEDVRVRRRYEERLRYLADHDSLTGLLNRRRFNEALAAHHDHCVRYGSEGVLMLLDLDGFKDVNDTLGHAAGDDILRSVSSILGERLRGTDIVARLGGDEFAVLLQRTHPQEAVAIGRDLITRIRNAPPPRPEVPALRVSATIGVAPFAGEPLAVRDVLAEADVALYEAKEGRRGGIALYTPQGQQRRIAQRMSWSEQIREALETDGFELIGQPVHDYATGRVTHHELLLRMTNRDGELVTPGRFLPIADQIGASRAIDRWVMERAIAIARDRPDVGGLLINLSAASLVDADLVREIEQLVHDAAVDPGRRRSRSPRPRRSRISSEPAGSPPSCGRSAAGWPWTTSELGSPPSITSSTCPSTSSRSTASSSAMWSRTPPAKPWSGRSSRPRTRSARRRSPSASRARIASRCSARSASAPLRGSTSARRGRSTSCGEPHDRRDLTRAGETG